MDLALEQARRAHELDPGSAVIAYNLANMHLMKGNDAEALRYAKVAQQLGMSKGTHGVEAVAAVRGRRWDEARRLLAQQEELPPELRAHVTRFVDALADPALRPEVVDGLRRLDPKVAKQPDLVGSYLQLGQVDLAYQILFAELERDPKAWVRRWDLNLAWSPEGEAFRKHPRFGELAARMGLADYWKQYGYPDGCRAGPDASVVCS